MTFGMMPIGALGLNLTYSSPPIGNYTTSFNNTGGLFNFSGGSFAPKMDWSFLSYGEVNSGGIGSSGQSLGLENSFGLNLNWSTPSLNFDWLGVSNNVSAELSGFSFTNPFMGNSSAIQKLFGLDFTMPTFGVSRSSGASFGSITSGSSISANNNSTFVPTSDYAENAARVAEQEEAKGVRETSKNDSVDIRRYKNGAKNSHQWCAYFTSYCFGAGQNKKPIFGFTGSSQHIRRQAEKAGVFAKKDSGYIPKRGDIAIWTNIGDPNHGHVGVVTKVYSDGSFDVIEGNSSNRVKKNHYKSPTSVSARFAGFCKTSEWAA